MRKKVCFVALILILTIIFASGACDPAMKERPYSIFNNSDQTIVFGYYNVSNTPNTEELLLKWLNRDIKSYIAREPFYKPLAPGDTYTVLSIGSRDDLLERNSESILLIWILEAKSLDKLNGREDLQFGDLDCLFLGTAKDLRDMNWEVVYQGKK